MEILRLECARLAEDSLAVLPTLDHAETGEIMLSVFEGDEMADVFLSRESQEKLYAFLGQVLEKEPRP